MAAKLILPDGTVAPDANLLDGIDSTLFARQSFKTIKVGTTNVDADNTSDTLELVGGSNISLTPDAANDKITIAVLEDSSHRFVTDTDKTNWNGKLNSSGGTITGSLTVNGTITGTLSGNASTASKLQTGRTITLSGIVSGSTTFDGSGNVTITTTLTSSTALTGTPTAPTAPVDTNTSQIATTAFVINQGYLKTESDTLLSVTGRGATTSVPTTFSGGVTSNSYVTGNFAIQFNSATNSLDFKYIGS